MDGTAGGKSPNVSFRATVPLADGPSGKPFLIASTAPKALGSFLTAVSLVAAGLLPAGGPLLESPGAREGLRAEQGLLGSGAAACAAGIGAQCSRGPGSALWVTPSRAASVRSRCTVSSHRGCRRQEQAEQTKAVSNGAEIKRTNSPLLRLPSLRRPGAGGLGHGGRAWGGKQEAGGDNGLDRETGQAEEANGTEWAVQRGRPATSSRGHLAAWGSECGTEAGGGRRHWSARTR